MHDEKPDARDERLAEATSGDTLSEVSETEKLTDKNQTSRDTDAMPAPDGDSTAHVTHERASGDAGEPM